MGTTPFRQSQTTHISQILQQCLFLFEDLTQGTMLHLLAVSPYSLFCNKFSSISFFFTTLTHLKSICQVFCILSFNLFGGVTDLREECHRSEASFAWHRVRLIRSDGNFAHYLKAMPAWFLHSQVTLPQL